LVDSCGVAEDVARRPRRGCRGAAAEPRPDARQDWGAEAGTLHLPGVVPTDEEFSARAREIADYTGSDQRAALNLIDHLGDELAEKMDRKVSEIEQAVEDENPDDDLPAPPPPNGER
jgi:hypothetical protein